MGADLTIVCDEAGGTKSHLGVSLAATGGVREAPATRHARLPEASLV